MAAPKLRFKEFDGDWSLSSLSKISSIITGNTPSTSNREYYDGEFLFVSPADIQENRYIEKTKTTLTANGFSKCRHIPENSVLFVCIGSTIGKVAQNKVICATNQQINAVIPQKGYSSDFLYLQLERLAPNIKLNAGVQAVPLINKTEFGKTLLNTPVYIEQTKIASFLSAVDEKISQLTQKHELLSQYKQGMMQKLFSQQIRFKADDGSEFGEWEEKTLIDSVDTNIKWSFTGGPFGSNLKSEDYTELGIRIIQLQNIGDGAFLNDYKIYTSPEKANELLSCNIYPDEILISKMGDPVARCCIVPKHHDRYVMCSDGIRLVVDKQNYSSIFMFYQINYQDFRQSASDVSTGSTRKRIGLSDLKQLPIKVPCLEEQTKIANFLSAIDQKIEVVAQQIEQAKQWKKGLLQQMFV